MSIFDCSVREYLTSDQLTSSKENFWPIEEFQRTDAVHYTQYQWLKSSQARCKEN